MSTDSDTTGAACASQAWSSNNSISQFPTTVFENFDASILSGNFQPSTWLSFQDSLDLESSDDLDSENLIGPKETQIQTSVTEPRSGFHGQFRGPSHPTNIVASFNDLRKFMKLTLDEHPILGAPQWATFLPEAEQPLSTHPPEKVTGVMKLLLPAEERCRSLLDSYFDHFTGIYALFHVPTFWHEYQNYQEGTHKDHVRFNALLLAMMSCARCFFPDEPLSFDGDSSTARNEALRWVQAVECWSSQRSAEGGIVERIQFKCLILLSKTLNDIDRKDHYTASQSLLADSISSGLHRDWKALGVEETFAEHELRRKVWNAVVELDLAACSERGVPSMVASLFVDIGPSKGYNDVDYTAGSDFEPMDQPKEKFTDGSFAKMAYAIRPIRYQIIDLVNNLQKHGTLSKSLLAALRGQISEALNGLPDWTDTKAELKRRNQGLVCRALLELQLHDLFLLLHLPFALAKDSFAMDMDFERFVCVRSASTIVRIYEEVVRTGFSPIALGTASILRAGLCLCLLEAGGGTTTTISHGITSLPICPATRLQLVKSTLNTLEHHVLCLGTDLQPLWLCFAASSYMETAQAPDASTTSRARTADKMIALFSKLCWAQKHKNIDFGLSNSQFARYVMQIHGVCSSVGLRLGCVSQARLPLEAHQGARRVDSVWHQ